MKNPRTDRGPLRVVHPEEAARRPPPARERPLLKFKVVLPAPPGWTAWFLDDFAGREHVIGYTVAAFGHVEHAAGDEIVPLVTNPYAHHAFCDPRPMHDFVLLTDPACGKKPEAIANEHAGMIRDWIRWHSAHPRLCQCHSWDDWLCAWIERDYAPGLELCECYCHEMGRHPSAPAEVPADAWFFNPPEK